MISPWISYAPTRLSFSMIIAFSSAYTNRWVSYALLGCRENAGGICTIWILFNILVCFLTFPGNQTLRFVICFKYLIKFLNFVWFGQNFGEEIHRAVEERDRRRSRLCNCLSEDSSRALCSWCLSGNFNSIVFCILYFSFNFIIYTVILIS